MASLARPAPPSLVVRSAPVISSAEAVSDTAGAALVKAPRTGIWSNFVLTVCEEADNTTCLQNVPPCPVVALPAAANCSIPYAQPFTRYQITLVAVQSGSPESNVSNVAVFTTRIP